MLPSNVDLFGQYLRHVMLCSAYQCSIIGAILGHILAILWLFAQPQTNTPVHSARLG